MLLCSITPKGSYHMMYRKPYVMLLAHLADDEEYVNEALKHEDIYKICDNSIIEMGESFTIEKEYEAAKKLHAQEIILPDGYPSGPKTIEMTKEAIQWMKDNNHLGEFKLMGVCHGENLEDFKATFDYLNNTPEIDVIGIPKVLSVWAGNRANLADIWTKTDKEIHYLGSWYSLKELIDLPFALNGRIRTCDSCLPAYYAITGKSVEEDREGTIELDRSYPELTEEAYAKVWDEYFEKLRNASFERGDFTLANVD